MQLTLSWCAAGNVGTTTKRTECCGTSNFRAHSKRPHQSKTSAASLATSTYADALSISCAALCSLSLHTRRCPAFLKNTVQLAAARQSRSDLWSSRTSAYLLPWLKTKFGERAFSHTGPSAWNALPTHIRDIPSPNSFRKLLKTHFFSLAFNVY